MAPVAPKLRARHAARGTGTSPRAAATNPAPLGIGQPGAGTGVTVDPTELLIGSEAQYFFDDAVIETLVNLKRTMHRPERHPGNPIIQSDRPWEQITYTACNGAQFWRDDGAGRFHCLYTNFKFDRDRYTRQGGSIHSPDVAVMSTLYAPPTTATCGRSRHWGSITRIVTTPMPCLGARQPGESTTWRCSTIRSRAAPSSATRRYTRTYLRPDSPATPR